MRRIPAALLSLFSLILFHASTQNAFAYDVGRVQLTVCNKGKVPVEVVVANSRVDFQDLKRASGKGHWEIIGPSYAPGQCREAFGGAGAGFNREAFIGFGFRNAAGKFVSGDVRDILDWEIGRASCRERV